MCSPEKICDLQLNLLPDRIKSDRRLKCVRCDGIRGKPALVIRTDDPAMCRFVMLHEAQILYRFCFVDGCVHKFKSAFGKSQLVPNGSRVAVAFSGGLCSTVMLDLIQRVRNHSVFLNRFVEQSPVQPCRISLSRYNLFVSYFKTLGRGT